jgi:hypothetical protein
MSYYDPELALLYQPPWYKRRSFPAHKLSICG